MQTWGQEVSKPARAMLSHTRARKYESTDLCAGAARMNNREFHVLARSPAHTVEDAVAMGVEVLAQILVAAHSVRVRMQLARDVQELGQELSLQILRRLPLPLVVVGVLGERESPRLKGAVSPRCMRAFGCAPRWGAPRCAAGHTHQPDSIAGDSFPRSQTRRARSPAACLGTFEPGQSHFPRRLHPAGSQALRRRALPPQSHACEHRVLGTLPPCCPSLPRAFCPLLLPVCL